MALTTQRVPGLLYNLESALFLRFQLNPTELVLSKTNRYSTIPISGWQEPVVVWSGGDFQTISFQLYFDARYNSLPPIPGVGVRDVHAVLTSFLFPQPKLPKSPSLASIMKAVKDRVEDYTPPPMAHFVFGAQWWQGYLQVSNMKMAALDPTLTPMSFECSVSMTVVSSGSFFVNDTTNRRFLATVLYPLRQSIDTVAAAISAVAGTAASLSNTVSSTSAKLKSVVS